MTLRRSFRKSQRSTMNVAAIESSDGTPNDRSHLLSGGIWSSKTTRFAGLEMGRRNDAALAMNAQTKREGRGATLDLRTAVRIAGVKTTAVASLDMSIVT